MLKKEVLKGKAKRVVATMLIAVTVVGTASEIPVYAESKSYWEYLSDARKSKGYEYLTRTSSYASATAVMNANGEYSRSGISNAWCKVQFMCEDGVGKRHWTQQTSASNPTNASACAKRGNRNYKSRYAKGTYNISFGKNDPIKNKNLTTGSL